MSTDSVACQGHRVPLSLGSAGALGLGQGGVKWCRLAAAGPQPLSSPQEAEVLVAQAQAPLHQEGGRGGGVGPGGAGTLGDGPPAAGVRGAV